MTTFDRQFSHFLLARVAVPKTVRTSGAVGADCSCYRALYELVVIVVWSPVPFAKGISSEGSGCLVRVRRDFTGRVLCTDAGHWDNLSRVIPFGICHTAAVDGLNMATFDRQLSHFLLARVAGTKSDRTVGAVGVADCSFYRTLYQLVAIVVCFPVPLAKGLGSEGLWCGIDASRLGRLEVSFCLMLRLSTRECIQERWEHQQNTGDNCTANLKKVTVTILVALCHMMQPHELLCQ